jgi:hypothetical protein
VLASDDVLIFMMKSSLYLLLGRQQAFLIYFTNLYNISMKNEAAKYYWPPFLGKIETERLRNMALDST